MHSTLHQDCVIPQYLFEHFFDISADLLCIAGFDGYFKKINPSVSAVLGYTNEELLSRPINDFVHVEDRPLTSNARASLKASNPLLNFENRYMTKTGDVVWLAWTSMPVEKERLVFAIAKNITHKKKQEAERNRLLQNMTQINEHLKQLTYTTSHDLRAPVNNLLAGFNILDVSKIKDDETVAYISMLKSAAEGLRKTLNHYVDALGKKEGLYTNLEEINLQESLDVVLFSINALVQDSNATIYCDFSAAESILFNKLCLESIFLNMITNSIKYARPGCSPEIHITSSVKNGTRRLTIRDNGLGFDMKYIQERMFGKQQKHHHHPDSTGIGLYLVHNHITALGGKIRVSSQLNQGSEFIISFGS
jgi:PAS domain S-box-containing protein